MPSPMELFAHATHFFGYKVVLLGRFNGQVSLCHAPMPHTFATHLCHAPLPRTLLPHPGDFSIRSPAAVCLRGRLRVLIGKDGVGQTGAGQTRLSLPAVRAHRTLRPLHQGATAQANHVPMSQYPKSFAQCPQWPQSEWTMACSILMACTIFQVVPTHCGARH